MAWPTGPPRMPAGEPIAPRYHGPAFPSAALGARRAPADGHPPAAGASLWPVADRAEAAAAAGHPGAAGALPAASDCPARRAAAGLGAVGPGAPGGGISAVRGGARPVGPPAAVEPVHPVRGAV